MSNSQLNDRDIRKKLHLNDACICGDLYGHPEDGDEDVQGGEVGFWPIPHLTPDLEYWDLSVPEVGDQDMRDSINMYCREGGALYPDELPLDDEVVDKHYDEYVKSVMAYDDDGDDDDVDSTMSAFKDLGFSDDDDEEGGKDGDDDDDDDGNWEDVDSEDEDDEFGDDDEDDDEEEFGPGGYGYFMDGDYDDDDDDDLDEYGFTHSLGMNPVELVLGMFMGGGPTQW